MVLRNGRERRDENEDAMRRMKQLQIRRTCSGNRKAAPGYARDGRHRDVVGWRGVLGPWRDIDALRAELMNFARQSVGQ